MTTSAAPRLEAGDTVSVAIGRLAYDGSFTVGTVSGNTFTYTSKTFSNSGTPSWTKTANSITANFASNHGVHAGDDVKVSGAPGGGSCSGTFPVTAATTTTPFTITYTVPGGGPGACNPGANGNQAYNFQLWDAAATAASGTVTLTAFTSATGSFGAVTTPQFVAPVAPSPNPCNTCVTVTDAPAIAVRGTFGINGNPGNPPFMPTSGAVGAAKGSVADPTPLLINSTTTLNPGTYYGGICLGSANGVDCAGANCATPSSSTAYSPAVTLNTGAGGLDATQSNVPIKWTGAAANPPDPVGNGDTIQIDNEQMVVTNVGAPTYSGGGNKNGAATLTVNRAANGTAGATHANNAAVSNVPPPPAPITVHMNAGEYIIAGGGFHVCGNMSLDAPSVLIFNTNDPAAVIGSYGAVGQIEINTTGTITLGRQTSTRIRSSPASRSSRIAARSSIHRPSPPSRTTPPSHSRLRSRARTRSST